MGEHSGPWRDGFLAWVEVCSQPPPPGSAAFELFRLENLFHALQDLWLADISELRAARRTVKAITGADCLPDNSDAIEFIGPTLKLGGVICNRAIEALHHEHPHAEPDAVAVGEYVLQLRDFLSALADLLDSLESGDSAPLEQQAARSELARLLGLNPDADDRELIGECFATAGAVATEAIAALQGAADLG